MTSVADPLLPTRKATLINGLARRQRPYASSHPLAIPRTALALELIDAYGAVTAAETVKARPATVGEVEWFHHPDYIAALLRAEAECGLRDEDRARFNLGNVENPYFERLFTIPATATGGSIVAAEQLITGRVAFNPAGGMHHARPASAQGFCYLNDPVLAVMRLRKEGWRVLYVDIDAHHGDGVERAFVDDPDVLTLSLHMDTAYAYPFAGGRLEDCGSGQGAYTTINIPLPQGTHDREYLRLFDAVWLPVVEKFLPDAIVLQAGADMLAADPLGRLRISTQCYLDVVRRVLEAAPRHADGTPRLMVTGGGGYHPLLVARAWTGVWGLLSGREIPAGIPAAGARVLRAAGWTMDEDEPYFPALFASRLDAVLPSPVRQQLRELAARTREHPFLRASC